MFRKLPFSSCLLLYTWRAELSPRPATPPSGVDADRPPGSFMFSRKNLPSRNAQCSWDSMRQRIFMLKQQGLITWLNTQEAFLTWRSEHVTPFTQSAISVMREGKGESVRQIPTDWMMSFVDLETFRSIEDPRIMKRWTYRKVYYIILIMAYKYLFTSI